MDVQMFDVPASAIGFTLLGLWWVVVQDRETWRMTVGLMVEPPRESSV